LRVVSVRISIASISSYRFIARPAAKPALLPAAAREYDGIHDGEFTRRINFGHFSLIS